MTRAESGHNSSTDIVCELHNCCEYMTFLLHEERSGRVCAPALSSSCAEGTATVRNLAHLEVLSLI